MPRAFQQLGRPMKRRPEAEEGPTLFDGAEEDE
jgi:hypothetical protein